MAVKIVQAPEKSEGRRQATVRNDKSIVCALKGPMVSRPIIWIDQ